LENTIIHSFYLNDYQCSIDLHNDFYGINFWQKFSNKKYEPDTFSFIQQNVDEKTIFLDIGCANGPFTLLALTKGCKVFAYEPNPDMYAVALRNISLNPKINRFCEINNWAISAKSGSIKFNETADTEILSPIVFSEPQISKADMRVEVKSLIGEITRVHEKDYKLVIKMDIEGAEWLILNDEVTLKLLKAYSSLLLLAVHPGFSRPFRKRLRGYNFFAHLFFTLKNYKTSTRVFEKINNYGKVYRTNFSEVDNKARFGFLVIGGYHEFIIDFNS